MNIPRDLRLSADMPRGEALSALRRAFAGAGIDSAGLDARVLAEAALGVDRAALVARPDLPLGAAGAARLASFAQRRLRREPVARILGIREFWGLPFRLSQTTLVPRPDTETLVSAVLDALGERRGDPLRILDLGTGSGAILVALLSECPSAIGVGIDRAAETVATARGNAEANGVGERAFFVVGNWAEALNGGFDIVAANPPYIETAELPDLDPEVREYDPTAALDGGCDGLDAYRAIAAEAPRLAGPGGLVALEVGKGQAKAVVTLLRGAGLDIGAVVPDLAGIDRVVLATMPR